MGLCISDCCRLRSDRSRSSLHIPVCKQADCRRSPERKNRRPVRSPLGTGCTGRKAMAYTVPHRVLQTRQIVRLNTKIKTPTPIRYNETTHYPPAGAGRHSRNGFPVILSGQTHVGIWFITSQLAFTPHVPGQGSLHLLPIQALSLGQSAFSTHSGRHIT